MVKYILPKGFSGNYFIFCVIFLFLNVWDSNLKNNLPSQQNSQNNSNQNLKQVNAEKDDGIFFQIIFWLVLLEFASIASGFRILLCKKKTHLQSNAEILRAYFIGLFFLQFPFAILTSKFIIPSLQNYPDAMEVIKYFVIIVELSMFYPRNLIRFKKEWSNFMRFKMYLLLGIIVTFIAIILIILWNRTCCDDYGRNFFLFYHIYCTKTLFVIFCLRKYNNFARNWKFFKSIRDKIQPIYWKNNQFLKSQDFDTVKSFNLTNQVFFKQQLQNQYKKSSCFGLIKQFQPGKWNQQQIWEQTQEMEIKKSVSSETSTCDQGFELFNQRDYISKQHDLLIQRSDYASNSFLIGFLQSDKYSIFEVFGIKEGNLKYSYKIKWNTNTNISFQNPKNSPFQIDLKTLQIIQIIDNSKLIIHSLIKQCKLYERVIPVEIVEKSKTQHLLIQPLLYYSQKGYFPFMKNEQNEEIDKQIIICGFLNQKYLFCQGILLLADPQLQNITGEDDTVNEQLKNKHYQQCVILKESKISDLGISRYQEHSLIIFDKNQRKFYLYDTETQLSSNYVLKDINLGQLYSSKCQNRFSSSFEFPSIVNDILFDKGMWGFLGVFGYYKVFLFICQGNSIIFQRELYCDINKYDLNQLLGIGFNQDYTYLIIETINQGLFCKSSQFSALIDLEVASKQNFQPQYAINIQILDELDKQSNFQDEDQQSQKKHQIKEKLNKLQPTNQVSNIKVRMEDLIEDLNFATKYNLNQQNILDRIENGTIENLVTQFQDDISSIKNKMVETSDQISFKQVLQMQDNKNQAKNYQKQFSKLTKQLNEIQIIQNMLRVKGENSFEPDVQILRKRSSMVMFEYDQLMEQSLQSVYTFRRSKIDILRDIKIQQKEFEKEAEQPIKTDSIRDFYCILLGRIAAVWTLIDITEDDVKNIKQKEFRQLTSTQMISIMLLLGFDITQNCFPRERPEEEEIVPLTKKQKLYGMKPQLKKDIVVSQEQEKDLNLIENQILQVFTGEGKSVILGIISVLYALNNLEVHIACLSKYQIQKDSQDFEKLYTFFEVQEFIKYGPIHQLSEIVLQKKSPIYHDTLALIDAKVATEQEKHVRNKRKNILLIDEIDSIFSQSENGKQEALFVPTVKFRQILISNILKEIWHKGQKTAWQQFFGSDQLFEMIKLTQSYKDLKEKYRKFIGLLDSQIRFMCSQICTFHEQNYSGNYKIVDQRIAYKMEDGTLNQNLDYGYLTQFAYLEAYNNGKLGLDIVDQELGIPLKCGQFAYTEIIKNNYAHIQGVTGCLDHLNTDIKDFIYQMYNIEYEGFIPSMFGENSGIDFDEQNKEFFEVTEGGLENQMVKIKELVTAKLKNNQAVLIFFENQAKLMDYVNSSEKLLAIKKEDHIIICEDIKECEIPGLVNRSAHKNTVTLITRHYAKGTNFVSYDDIVNQNGGVVVIQTFMSVNFNEQIMIQGKTGRSGQPGSYHIVASEDDTLKLFQTSKQLVNHWRDTHILYDQLDQLRNIQFYQQMIQYKDSVLISIQKHQITQQYIEALQEDNPFKAVLLLKMFNQQPDH